MGVEYQRRPTGGFKGIRRKQTVITSTATILPLEGVALIRSSTDADRIFLLPAPKKGVELTVLGARNNSTDTVTVRTLTTAVTFFGSTRQSVVFTTGVGVDRAIDLIGISTAPSATPKWAVRSVTGGTLT